MATAGNTVHKLQKFAYSSANNTMVHNSDVIVQGNLTVVGTQVYAQTTTLIVKDNIITLNAAINQSGVPLFDAGIEIDRGSEQNVALLWKESEGAWKFTNDGVNYETLGGGSAGAYANAAFLQANAAFASANNVAPQVQPAFNTANAAFLQANAAFASANNVAPQVQPAFDKANAAYAFANTTTAWGTRQTFVATAGQTVFNVGSGYLVGYIDVYYNGIKLYGGDDYTASDGLSVTLTNPALVDDIIEVVGFGANVPVANIYVLNSTTSFVNRQTFFATANQTTFTPTQSYRVGYIDVYYNGLKMVIPDDVVANNGTTIEFIGLTPTTNDVIEIVGLTPNVALANAIPITGGSVSGNLLPAATNTYYLGSETNRWHSLFVGPGSIDIGGLVLSNSGGTLAVTSAAGAPSTFIDTFARGQANAAFNSANNVAPQVQPAFDRANAAFAAANNVAPQVQPAFDTANAAFAAANNVAPQIAPAFTQANAAFAAANNVAPQIAPAFAQANAAFAVANSAVTYGSNTATTSLLSLPTGTTAQRPANPQPGSIRYNTTLTRIEAYMPTIGWREVVGDTYSVEVLIVAGGGGGGNGTPSGYEAGGGGGGGLKYYGSESNATGSAISVTPGQSFVVTVGAGGGSSANGGSSSFGASYTTLGGGYGGPGGSPGASGGSGGGGGHQSPGGAGTPGQGNPGGGPSASKGGAGGGAGGAGPPGSVGNGGLGLTFLISGSSLDYAGGGLGALAVSSTVYGGAGGVNAAGTANRGGGGGGAYTGGPSGSGGAGGSGIVIVRYLGSQRGTGGTISSSGGYTIHTFTGSGTFTA